MVVRGCLLLLLLSSGSAFVLMPKNATGRVAGDLTLLYRYAYRWDMPEVPPPSPSAVTPSHLHPHPLPSRLLQHLSLTFLIHHAAPAPLCTCFSTHTCILTSGSQDTESNEGLGGGLLCWRQARSKWPATAIT
jgi:hypothetical protein